MVEVVYWIVQEWSHGTGGLCVDVVFNRLDTGSTVLSYACAYEQYVQYM